jgi:hypothetical protein
MLDLKEQFVYNKRLFSVQICKVVMGTLNNSINN